MRLLGRALGVRDVTPPDAAPVAVVTGAGGGIGRAFAVRLGALGYRLVLVDLDHAALGATHAKLLPTAGPDHELVVADVADAGSWDGLAATLAHDAADVALLVQGAGVLVAGRLVDCPPEDIDRLVRVNLTGALLGARALGPQLADGAAAQRAAGANSPPLPRGLLNVASIFAAVTPPGFAAYNASKAGVVALSETLRGEWAPAGLHVTVVLPGVTPTGLFRRAFYANERLRETVLRRVGEAALTADRVADEALVAHRRRRGVAAIGGRATRYLWLKRWFPESLARGVAREANRELGD